MKLKMVIVGDISNVSIIRSTSVQLVQRKCKVRLSF